MKPLNKILGHLDNPEADLLSEESQLRLVKSIEELLIFNYENWYKLIGSKLVNTNYLERLELFRIWNESINEKIK